MIERAKRFMDTADDRKRLDEWYEGFLEVVEDDADAGEELRVHYEARKAQIEEKINKNEEGKREEKRALLQREGAASKTVDVPFYFIDTDAEDAKYYGEDVNAHKLLAKQYDYFVKDLIENKELLEAFRKWQDDSRNVIKDPSKFSERMKSSLISYAGSQYKRVFEVFEKMGYDATKTKIGGTFSSIFDNQPALPPGIRLFEGFGNHTFDLDPRRIRENGLTLREGDIINRARPTSTSWHPNSALNFMNEGPFATSNDYGKVTSGSLVVYTVNSTGLKGVMTQEMLSLNKFEMEVTLQPMILIKVKKILLDVDMGMYHFKRYKEFRLVKCDIIYVEI